MTTPPARHSEERLEDLFNWSRDRLFQAGGGWLWWYQIRPPVNADRLVYEEFVWMRILGSPEFETEEIPHGVRVRRRVRMIALTLG
jgi:hypothetical protein